ncbi:MAG TPA: chalcone isomerase family protein [Geobacteraceae bacterium]
MKKMLIVFMLSLLSAAPARAVEVAGVTLEPTATVNSRPLKLNGYGIRKKFFVKVYIGSLYLTRQAKRAEEVLGDPGDKLIRMNFLHNKVEKGKITEAFGEGIANNAPEVVGSPEAKKFLGLFTGDFRKGDVVDLVLAADGAVTAKHNGRLLGTVTSVRLARAILAIYLGPKPADEGLKQGMLGKDS